MIIKSTIAAPIAFSIPIARISAPMHAFQFQGRIAPTDIHAPPMLWSCCGASVHHVRWLPYCTRPSLRSAPNVGYVSECVFIYLFVYIGRDTTTAHLQLYFVSLS